jgi:antitoxin component HigA of HigAB toxin-antitoxin module
MIDYEAINRDLTDRAPGWVAVKPIRSEVDYREALDEVDRLSGATEASPEDDLLAVLSALVAAYEAEQD